MHPNIDQPFPVPTSKDHHLRPSKKQCPSHSMLVTGISRPESRGSSKWSSPAAKTGTSCHTPTFSFSSATNTRDSPKSPSAGPISTSTFKKKLSSTAHGPTTGWRLAQGYSRTLNRTSLFVTKLYRTILSARRTVMVKSQCAFRPCLRMLGAGSGNLNRRPSPLQHF